MVVFLVCLVFLVSVVAVVFVAVAVAVAGAGAVADACFALLCFALLRFALLCFALPCFASFCVALLCFASLRFLLRCFALRRFALLCFALRRFALRCVALLFFVFGVFIQFSLNRKTKIKMCRKWSPGGSFCSARNRCAREKQGHRTNGLDLGVFWGGPGIAAYLRGAAPGAAKNNENEGFTAVKH